MIYRNHRYFDRQLAKFTRDGRNAGLPLFATEIAAHIAALGDAPTYQVFFDSLDALGWTVRERRAGARFDATLTMPCGQGFGVSGRDVEPEQLSFVSWQKR